MCQPLQFLNEAASFVCSGQVGGLRESRGLNEARGLHKAHGVCGFTRTTQFIDRSNYLAGNFQGNFEGDNGNGIACAFEGDFESNRGNSEG